MSCCDKPTSGASSASKEGCCAPSQSCETSKPSCCTPAQQPQQQQAPPKAAPCCGPACCTEPSETKENCCDSSCCDKAAAASKPTGYTKPACCDKVLPEASSVKQQVRADYARVAVASALNADTVAEKFGYTQQDLAAIPQGANMGVSCGNPLALANVKEGEVVVDLGCGRGLDVFLASPKVGPSGKVYGIDMTPEMLAKARENAAKKNITNVEFLAGEIEALPLPDNSADLVISNCVINLVPDKQKAFTEIYRVLKPGGRLAISDILKKKPLPDTVRDKVELISTCFVGAMTHAEGVEYLQKAGFKSILISDANVDLNAYKELSEQGGGCCGSASGCGGSSVSFNTFKDIDFNEYTFSGKIFASKE